MSDLISRQAMLDGIDKLIKIHFDRTVVLYKARKVAEDLPSAQPERKKGHWVYRPEWSKCGDVWSCSECGEKTSQSVMGEPRFKYCPMCDAKMESVGEQE